MDKENCKTFDIVIFGATGFTGRYVIEELVNVIHKTNRNIKWAIAGRNKDKLRASLESVQQYLEKDIMNTDILEADVRNVDSIAEMCKKTKLILNCVGPYKFYGEIVVKTCIEYGTHHVDISIEIKYLEETQAKYFHAAESKGVYIVQSCGFGSIPIDFGVTVLKGKFPGDLSSVESYTELIPDLKSASFHVGTWVSGIHTICDILNSKSFMKLLKEKVFTKEIPKSSFPLVNRILFFYNKAVKMWCFPYPDPGERIIARSQMFDYQFFEKRPVQFNTYVCFKSLIMGLTLIFLFGFFCLMSLFWTSRYFLAKYPSVFSFGMCSSEGPTRHQIEKSGVKITLHGKGWAKKLSDPLQRHIGKPTAKRTLVITGPNPGYVVTSICMVNAGLVILEESNKMPLNGGVLTPGAAFGKTTLCERLQNRGITFEFLES